jgi:hypothetical protein
LRGCSACEHAWRRHAAGRRLPRPMEPQLSGGTEAAAGAPTGSLEHRHEPVPVATFVRGEGDRHRGGADSEPRRQVRPAELPQEDVGSVASVDRHKVVIQFGGERDELELDGRRAGDDPCAPHGVGVAAQRDGDGLRRERDGLAAEACGCIARRRAAHTDSRRAVMGYTKKGSEIGRLCVCLCSRGCEQT